MPNKYVNLSVTNLEQEHVCCAIADKKHQCGVVAKKQWLSDRLQEGHVFRKLNQKGKVFIEYAPLESAWVPIEGNNYMYIYCLWVSGSFKGKGHARELLTYCLEEAKAAGKSGVCVLSSKKKKPFLSEKKFFSTFGFEVVDTVGEEYELLACSFDGGAMPRFSDLCRTMTIKEKELTIYYSPQCPYILNCLEQVRKYCESEGVPFHLVKVDSLERAKEMPCLFNNWAVFYEGKFRTVHLLNENQLKKFMENK